MLLAATAATVVVVVAAAVRWYQPSTNSHGSAAAGGCCCCVRVFGCYTRNGKEDKKREDHKNEINFENNAKTLKNYFKM